jgi:predicted aldo/keto reductase-like oxidoreductase
VIKKRKNYNRREFLSRTVSGIASVGLLGFSEKSVSTLGSQKLSQNTHKEIIYRTLGKTGIKLPIVNMGVMNTLDPAVVKRSYEIGVRHFDTAAWYMRGRNEEMIGKVIKDLKVRDKVIIGTKIYIPHEQREMSPEKARDTLDSIPKGKGLDRCTSCDPCIASCSRLVDIRSRIEELKTIYA